jgi:hypothetical protein
MKKVILKKLSDIWIIWNNREFNMFFSRCYKMFFLHHNKLERFSLASFISLV